MKCFRFSVFVSVLSLVFFSALFLNVYNVSAVSDFSVSAPAFTSVTICDDNDSNYPNCSDFSFLKVENSGDSLSSCGPSSGPVLNGALYGGLGFFDPIIVGISSSKVYVSNYQGMNQCASSGSFSFTYTLVSSLSNCPVCEECQVCPAVPENPYDDKFDKIITAIYTCGAILLVIYFFYCIYRMIIKSTGGNQ